jgi:hypothetical protein
MPMSDSVRGEKLHQHSDVEFGSVSDGDSPEAEKPYLDPV